MSEANSPIVDSQDSQSFVHIPVLGEELMAGLNPAAGGCYLDATVGAGGHSRLLLSRGDRLRLVAVDRDAQALAAARQNLQEFGDRVSFWHGNFAEYPGSEAQFDGIFADLGASSPQLDTPERGFSFRHEGALDMRMDRRQSLTAAEIANRWTETKLAEIFYNYGEERFSRRIARRIVQTRPFHTTTDLAEAIAQCVPTGYRYGRIHPATRVFQALRIAVNQELTALENFLARSPAWLKPNGILGVISFHSLEDRLVKHHLRDSSLLQVLTKKPLCASSEEQKRNPRSRSAKLRLARRVDVEGADAG